MSHKIIKRNIVDSESERNLLKQRIFFTQVEINQSGYAPIASKHIKKGMTVSDLCAASFEYSDNAATNQLMKIVDGPNKVTQFAHAR